MRFENRKVSDLELEETPIMRPRICCIKPKYYPSISEIEKRQE